MRQKISRVMLLLVGATIALAAIGAGYGMWFDTLTITGQVRTGTIALSFVSVSAPTDTPAVLTPYTNDDNVVNNNNALSPYNDLNDTGLCAYPAYNDDHDTYTTGIQRIDEDPIDGLDNDGDGKIDEDPPGKLSTCDPHSTPVWTSTPFVIDEDRDGLYDEDPAGDGDSDSCPGTYSGPDAVNDDDCDGLVDEDGLGGWVLPFASATDGQDIGKTIASVNGGGKILMVDLANPTVNLLPNGEYRVYSPTVYAKVVNTGSVPVIVADYLITVAPPYEPWDRDGNGSITRLGDPLLCQPIVGEECAAPLTAWLTKLDGSTLVGTVLDPNVEVAIKLKVSMTPAAKSTVNYGMTLTITGAQYNEP